MDASAHLPDPPSPPAPLPARERGEGVRVYPAYKDSGILWLGNIPTHWEINKIKHVASLKSGESITAEGINQDQTFPVFGGNGLRGYTNTYTHDGHFVLIGRQGALCGNINYGFGKFFASEHAVVVTPLKQIVTLWLGELLRTMDLNQYSISAAQPGIAVDRIKELRIPHPPFDEQIAIASFLDRQTAKIDTLIARKLRLVELLQEKRAALISQAVTKGLNPNVKMKDSGVEWLGEVPEPWEVKRLKTIVKILRGKFTHRPRNDPLLYDGPYPFIQTGDIAKADKYLIDYQQTLNQRGFSVSAQFPSGTLVMSIAANIGDVAILKFTACFPDSIVGLLPDDRTDQNYLYYSLSAFKTIMLSMAIQNTQLNLNIERIGVVKIAYPSIDEQQKIATYLDRQTSGLDSLIARIQSAIEKLREYRAALISAAVTGKIDVRS